MGTIHDRWRHGVTRRQALVGLAGMLAGSPFLHAQPDPRPLKDHRRIPGLDEMQTAFDFEPVCFANLPLAVYDYTAHGTDSEFTLRRNREAFEWVDLVERPGASVGDLNTSSTVLGLSMDVPIMIAPTARQGELHPDGEGGMYAGATAAGTPMIVADPTSLPIEQIAASADGPRWSQHYATPDLNASRERIEQFEDAGARAIVLTVDQTTSRYERDIHDRHTRRNTRPPRAGPAPPVPTAGPGLYRIGSNRLWYTWDHFDKIRALVKVPTLIKGVLTAEDARLCVVHGYDGIIVSNHGGRAMDYGPSSLEVLPEIVDAVGGRIPVIIDSGFRRGADIVKAIALGAQAVCLGRTARWALAAFGPPGVQRLLEILQAEFLEAMAKTGRTTLAALDRTAVKVDIP